MGEPRSPTIEVCASIVLTPGCSDDNSASFLINSSGPNSIAKATNKKLMGEFLAWPETPKRKGKRQIERYPFINI